ncbi:DENN domain-containing protein 1A-like isoform X5 [Anopheles darlingi]|uniref:DENN domain-containing protein 1A-like isoform X5 n=1 Tax=Anopheles darlingi TaxID=43151 RepID=UPI0021003823|nr:DENN domain-containing protein 1A-like isoform X5 [Anopheles darlingi]
MNSRIKEDVSRLFEFWCEIAPGKPDDPTAPGYIVESFPESFKDAKVIADIPAFAYPCAFESRTIQVHSFVLTNIDSKWRFGFCRHDPKSPTAMVIVTYLPWHDTFMRFLNVLADIKKNRPDEFGAFLAESYGKGVPEPGACLKLSYDRPVQTFSFQRPQQFQLPSIPENHNLNQYYNFVEPKFMIGIFAAMLAERRIIFVSRRLDILSSCVQAANAFLYPMVWQHIFIPVLPMQMVDILGAPMPFLIGVPEAVYETLRREEIGDVVILNCDKRTLETPFDDVKSMPPELVASLKKQLSNPADHRGDRVSKIFLGILVQLIGGYRDAVKFNDKITFDPDTFIESRPSHLRAFLSNMLQLQIFQQFIEERLDMLNTGQGFSDEFEVEYFRYAEKSGRKVKQYKDLLKNFKDKVTVSVSHFIPFDFAFTCSFT